MFPTRVYPLLHFVQDNARSVVEYVNSLHPFGMGAHNWELLIVVRKYPLLHVIYVQAVKLVHIVHAP